MKLPFPYLATFFRVLSNRNYAIYVSGNTISIVGMWVQRIAIGWLVWELTGSGAWLGAVALAEFLPTVVLTPLGGVLADRFDRLMISIVSQAFALVQALILCALTALGTINVELVVLLSFVGGALGAINTAARLTLVPMMVPHDLLPSAIGINAITFNLARVVGPAIGGFLLAYFGLATAFAFNAASYAAIIVALLLLRLKPFEPKAGKGQTLWQQIFGDLADACRYIFHHQALSTLLAVIGVSALLAHPITDLLPGFVGDVFDRGPGAFATFTMAMGWGAVGAGLWLAFRGNVSGLTTITLTTVFLSGLTSALFAMTDIFQLAVVILFVAGFTHVVSGIASQTLIQTSIDEEMRGRVLGLWWTLMRGGAALGALLLGSLAEIFGFQGPLAVAGVFTMAAALVAVRRRAALSAQFEGVYSD